MKKAESNGIFEQFLKDPHAKKYADVLHTEVARRAIQDFVEFFSSPDVQRRMMESELHHDRPALAGVVKDLDKLIAKQIEQALEIGDLSEGPTSKRRNQLIGVIVKVVMNHCGWRPTGRKGSLAGLSDFFTRSERYERKKG